MKLDIGVGDNKVGEIGLDIRKTVFTDVQASCENIPFKNEAFSDVYAIMILKHIDKPFEVLNEIYRVLKVGGTFYGKVPLHSKMTFYQFKQLMLLRVKHALAVHKDLKSGEHKWQFDTDYTKLFLEILGFKNITVTVNKVFPYFDGVINMRAEK